MPMQVHKKEIRDAALRGINEYLQSARASNYFGTGVEVVVIKPGDKLEVRFHEEGERRAIVIDVR